MCQTHERALKMVAAALIFTIIITLEDPKVLPMSEKEKTITHGLCSQGPSVSWGVKALLRQE